MTAHTPGDWGVELDAPTDGDISIVANPHAPPYEWVFVAAVDCREEQDDQEPPRERALANAHLMAASPALLEALRPFAEVGQDLTDALCHRGLVTTERCGRCSRVLAARVAIAVAQREVPV